MWLSEQRAHTPTRSDTFRTSCKSSRNTRGWRVQTTLLSIFRKNREEQEVKTVILDYIKEAVGGVDKLIEKQARIHMAGFDSKIRDFYQQFDSIEKRLIRIEDLLKNGKQSS